MNRRGALLEVPWSFLIEIVLLVMVVAFLLVQANDVVKNDRFERLFHVRDISLLYNTIGSLSGSLEYSYEMLGRYNLNILQGKTEVLQQNENSGNAAVYYPFFEDASLLYEYDLIVPQKAASRTTFSLQKNDAMQINENAFFAAETCPNIETFTDEKTVFIFDKGNIFDYFVKENKLHKQQFTLAHQKGALEEDIKGIVFDIRDAANDIAQLHTSPTLKGRKFACLFANQLRKKNIPVIIFSGAQDTAREVSITLSAKTQGKEAILSAAFIAALENYFWKKQ